MAVVILHVHKYEKTIAELPLERCIQKCKH